MKKKGLTSQYIGVSHTSASKKKPWRAEIRVNYKLIFLGHYETEEAAARAFNEAALRYRGSGAWVNDIERGSDE